MTRNIHKALSKTAQLTNRGNQNLFRAFIFGTTNNNNSPKQRLHNNKLMNIIVVPNVKNYSSSVNSNNTTRALNPVEYKSWSKEDVCYLLCTPESNGGAGLTVEDVKPLYDAGFKGTSLGNIVTLIQKKDEFFAIEQVKQNKDYQNISQTTLEILVFWVDNLLKTRLYHRWPASHIRDLFNLDLLLNISDREALINEKDNKLANDHWLQSKLSKEGFKIVSEWKRSLLLEPRLIYEPYEYPLTELDSTDKKYVFLSKLSMIELEYLQKIKDLPLEITAQFDKFSFTNTFRNRNKSIEIVKEMALKARDNFIEGNPNKQHVFFTIVKGGSGSGKSRLLFEMKGIINSLSTDYQEFKRTELLYFNFTNGFSLDEFQERDKLPISLIGSRLVYASFNNDIASQFPLSTKYILLFELLRIVSVKLHEKHSIPLEEPIPLVIALDEFQKATAAISGLGTTIQHLIGYYIRNYQKRDGLMIIPVLAGTLIESDIRFIPTDYSGKSLELPFLHPQDTEAILLKENIAPRYYLGRYALVWDLIGMVPRHLEWAVDHFNKLNKSNPLETILGNTFLHVASRANDNFRTAPNHYGMINYLANLTISGYSNQTLSYLKTNRDELHLLKSSGLIHQTENNKLYLPLIGIHNIESNEVPKHVLESFIFPSHRPEFENLEALTLKTLTSKFNIMFSYEKQSSVAFNVLFEGAHYPTSLKECKITICQSLGNFFMYKETDTTFETKHLSNDAFTKSRPNQEAIDGCGPNILLNKKKYVMVFQCKLSPSPTIEPAKIDEYYRKTKHYLQHKCKLKNSLVVIITRAKVTAKTATDIENGNHGKDLVLISGDLFSRFFNEIVGNLMMRATKYESPSQD